MANSNNTPVSINQLFDAIKDTAKEQIRTKTAGKSQKQLLIKKIASEKKEVVVSRDILVQGAEGDQELTIRINAEAEVKLAQIDAEYKELMESFNIYNVEVGEAAADAVMDKITAPIAPITRSATAGVKRLISNLTGIGEK